MSSFEELALGPEIVDALTAEGFETPSSFQEEAIPVVGRGTNLVGRAGPGAGVLLSYGAPLLDRIDPVEGAVPGALILVPTRARATELARSLARIAMATGHRVAALGGRWAVPERARLLFGTPADFLAAVEGSTLKLDPVTAFVVDGAAQIRALGGLDAVETLVGLVPSDAQKIVLSLPLAEEVGSFVERHVRRPARIPSRAALRSDEESDAPRRGTLQHRIVDGDRLEATLATVADLLVGEDDADADHVLIHFHSDEAAADVGDALTLHGYEAGAPGDTAAPVWLGTDALESREILDSLEEPARVATLSHQVPLDVDALDLRHGRGGPAVVLSGGREIAHLERCARVAGYELRSFPDSIPPGLAEEISGFRSRIEGSLRNADLASNLLLLEPLLREHGAARVAAAAAALVRSGLQGPGAAPGMVGLAPPEVGREAGTPRAWVRLFFSLGTKDDAGPGDLLGAITGEAQVEGSRVGRIDIQDTFSIVEVDQRVAHSVIEAMNGITVKGRSLRVDYHRPRSGTGRKEVGGGGRGGHRRKG